MKNKKLNILQINSCDIGGGAANIAFNLFNKYKINNSSYFFVGQKNSDYSDIFIIPNNIPENLWQKICLYGFNFSDSFVGKIKGFGMLKNIFKNIANPRNVIDKYKGFEVFGFPGIYKIFDILPISPDIINCHNLHSNFFDLNALPWLSDKYPLVLTLHDAWLLGGHCAHSLNCQRWQDGCFDCPRIDLYPAIKKDSASYNFKKKSDIYKKSKYYVITPCNWLMNKVKKSILTNGLLDSKVINNGVDLSIFKFENKKKIRLELGINLEKKVLLFVGQGTVSNIWKDFFTLKEACIKASTELKKNILLICLGEKKETEYYDFLQIDFLPYQNDPEIVAKYYQASDLYLHISNIDTFPNSILESLACACPVIATNVGGIGEQVKRLDIYSTKEATGFLAEPKNVKEIIYYLKVLLNNDDLLFNLAKNSLNDAKNRFNIDIQVSSYLKFYNEILENRKIYEK